MIVYKWEWDAFKIWCVHSPLEYPIKDRLEYLQKTEYWAQYRDMIQFERPNYGMEQIVLEEEFIKNDHKGNPIFKLLEPIQKPNFN